MIPINPKEYEERERTRQLNKVNDGVEIITEVNKDTPWFLRCYSTGIYDPIIVVCKYVMDKYTPRPFQVFDVRVHCQTEDGTRIELEKYKERY